MDAVAESVPAARDIQRVADAQARFDAAIADLDDATARQPSALPGWTVAHVLTHVARNADSHVRRSDAAARGESVEQYLGGYAGRAAEIDAGADRPAADLVADVRDTGARLAARWASLPARAWTVTSVDVGGRERPLHALVGRRWQELEVHIVDLGIGVTPRDWPDDFVTAWLPRLRASLPTRLPEGAEPPAAGSLDDRDELAWLYGRSNPPGLPVLAPWG